MKFSSTVNATSAAADTTRARSGLALWLCVRITGFLLAVLVFAHFAYTHLIHDVADTNATFVLSRMRSPLFLAWDLLMLGLALFHGAAGGWVVIREYTTKWRRFSCISVILFVSLMFILGSLILI